MVVQAASDLLRYVLCAKNKVSFATRYIFSSDFYSQYNDARERHKTKLWQTSHKQIDFSFVLSLGK